MAGIIYDSELDLAVAEAYRRADLDTPQYWAEEDWPRISAARAERFRDALRQLGYRIAPL